MLFLPRLRIILQSNYLFYISLIITLIIIFIHITYFPNQTKINPTKSFEGIITNIKYDGIKYTIHIKSIEEVIGYYQSDNINLKLGDKVKVEGTFYEPSNNLDSDLLHLVKMYNYE